MRYLTTLAIIAVACFMVAPISAQLLRRRAVVLEQSCPNGVCGPQTTLQTPILAVKAPIVVETLPVAPRAPLVALVPAEAAADKPSQKMPVGDGPTVAYAPAPVYAAPVFTRRAPLRAILRRIFVR